MYKQFDLEEQIMDCWRIVDDLKVLTEHVVEDDDDATTDSIANILIGLEKLYQLKFARLFDTFEIIINTPISQQSGPDVEPKIDEDLVNLTYPPRGHFMDGDWVDDNGDSLINV